MVRPFSPAEEPERVDALRRRLYRPDATEADRQRYASATRSAAAAAPAPVPDDPVDPVAGDASAPPVVARVGRLRGRIAAVSVGSALAAVVTVALLAAGGGRARPAAPPPARSEVAVASTDRDGFVRTLGTGRDAGLAAYFFTHPLAVPAALRTTNRADTQEYHGEGASTLPLAPSSLSYDGGRVTLVLVTDSSAAVDWTVTRIDTRRDWTSYPRTLGHGAATQQAGVPVPSTVRYTGAPPMHVRVRAPAGVRWGAIVVLTD